ncbi:MAG: hypothetical protein ACI8X5_002253 [Planctomycetota bacterium]
MILPALAALVLSSIHPVALEPQEAALETYYLVRLELNGEKRALKDLAARGLDVSHVHLGATGDANQALRTAEMVIDAEELEALRFDGWNPEVVIEDLQAHYIARLQNSSQAIAGTTYGAWLSPTYAAGSMSGYYNFSELTSVLDQVHNAYPNIVSAKSSIGQSLEGREIWMLKVSDNPGVDEAEPEVRFDSLHHAREPEGMQASLWFLLWLVEEYGTDPLATYLVNEREIYFIPCVNPDGYSYNEQIAPSGGGLWRKNRRNNGGGSFGVDLNRNYPLSWGIDDDGSSPDPDSETYRGTSAASEPEVQAMISFISGRDFATVLTLHCYSNLWLAPLGYVAAEPANQAQYDEIGALATEFNGYPRGPASTVLYLANGTTLDYDHGVHDSLTWTPELGGAEDGFWPAPDRIVPIAEENRIALARTALAAGSYLHVESISGSELIGDNDQNFEGGETIAIAVQIRNSGLQPASPVEVQLFSLSPELQVMNGSGQLGTLASFSTGSAATAPTLRILPGTAQGNYPYELRVISGSWQEVLSGEVIVGSEQIVATYDFEASGNQGWSVGSPNDASTGIWTRVNPRGTAAQPEDDHTAGSGNTDCWVTGQGAPGGSVGDSDVDGGTTSLESPVFDLAGATAATVSYWRWYSNVEGGAPNADIFQVDLSNDGGSNWTNAEVVGPAGPGTSGGWIEASFDPGQLLPLTNQMRLRFRASDLGEGSIVEAAIDDVLITFLIDGDCPAPIVYCGTSPNTVGTGATIGSSGSTGIGEGTFTLHASGIPADNFGLFFYGAGQNLAPLGEGTLCISSPFTRLNVQQANGAGEVDQLLNLTSPLDAGTTWNFQFWYRDPAGGPVGFNLSDALEVSICN